MVPRLLAIALIFVGTSLAWFTLGGTVARRTSETGRRMQEKVQSVWGSPQFQAAPVAFMDSIESAPQASDLRVKLNLEHRRKGLLWYATYQSEFEGAYAFTNPSAEPRAVRLRWTFPSQGAVYDDLRFLWNGVPLSPQASDGGLSAVVQMNPSEQGRLTIGYRSQGLDAWHYLLGSEVRALPNFQLRVSTNVKGIDFDDNTLAPTAKRETAQGWDLDWSYRNLYAGREISVLMPQRKQPGPMAAQMSFFAPVSLLFFFFAVQMLAVRRELDLHPMHFFFMACAFFSFHLLMAYLVDHLDIYAAFGIAGLVSVFLLMSYLRGVAGPAFAIREAGVAQVVYLVLFSLAFFFEGYTGLTVTIGAILTLFVTMQLTAKVRWQPLFKTSKSQVV